MSKLYKINSVFAQQNKLPVYFVANEVVSTPKASYLFGRGTLETQKIGACCVCGRTLTHPVSVLLGIGPECGSHWWDWNAVGGYTEENLAKLRMVIFDMKVDQWIPKACIKEVLDTTDAIVTPEDHKMLKRVEKPTRTAELVDTPSTGKLIQLRFPFDFTDLDRVKSIPGRKFRDDASGKYWTVPFTLSIIEDLIKWKFTLSQELLNYREKLNRKPHDLDHINIPGLKGKLFPFQEKGVAFIESRNGRAMIADEMGLGKTVQALAYLQLHPELRPAIVVCPASLKLNWQKEALDWLPKPECQIISGRTADESLTGKIIIVNYDVLDAWIPKLQKIRPKIMITDECHYYKSNTANRTKAVKKLAKSVPNILALSGTPIINRPVEMFNALSIIDPTAVPPFWQYAQRYCGAKHNGYGWDFNGATNTEELHELLTRTIVLRRKKADVLTDLPDKIYSFVPMELNNKREYYAAENDFIGYVRATKGAQAAQKASNAEVLAQIEALKQLAVAGKIEQAIEWISNFLYGNGKLVVFATHKSAIDELMKAFGDIAVKIDGSVSLEGRNKAVEEFQKNDKIRLFVGNIQAAGVGLTLTAASNVAFLELPWTPGALSQATDRVHRIGQKESVTVHYLLSAGTIEEKIAKLLDNKLKILDAVLDGKITEEESLLTELMNEYSKN